MKHSANPTLTRIRYIHQDPITENSHSEAPTTTLNQSSDFQENYSMNRYTQSDDSTFSPDYLASSKYNPRPSAVPLQNITNKIENLAHRKPIPKNLYDFQISPEELSPSVEKKEPSLIRYQDPSVSDFDRGVLESDRNTEDPITVRNTLLVDDDFLSTQIPLSSGRSSFVHMDSRSGLYPKTSMHSRTPSLPQTMSQPANKMKTDKLSKPNNVNFNPQRKCQSIGGRFDIARLQLDLANPNNAAATMIEHQNMMRENFRFPTQCSDSSPDFKVEKNLGPEKIFKTKDSRISSRPSEANLLILERPSYRCDTERLMTYEESLQGSNERLKNSTSAKNLIKNQDQASDNSKFTKIAGSAKKILEELKTKFNPTASKEPKYQLPKEPIPESKPSEKVPDHVNPSLRTVSVLKESRRLISELRETLNKTKKMADMENPLCTDRSKNDSPVKIVKQTGSNKNKNPSFNSNVESNNYFAQSRFSDVKSNDIVRTSEHDAHFAYNSPNGHTVSTVMQVTSPNLFSPDSISREKIPAKSPIIIASSEMTNLTKEMDAAWQNEVESNSTVMVSLSNTRLPKETPPPVKKSVIRYQEEEDRLRPFPLAPKFMKVQDHIREEPWAKTELSESEKQLKMSHHSSQNNIDTPNFTCYTEPNPPVPEFQDYNAQKDSIDRGAHKTKGINPYNTFQEDSDCNDSKNEDPNLDRFIKAIVKPPKRNPSVGSICDLPPRPDSAMTSGKNSRSQTPNHNSPEKIEILGIQISQPTKNLNDLNHPKITPFNKQKLGSSPSMPSLTVANANTALKPAVQSINSKPTHSPKIAITPSATAQMSKLLTRTDSKSKLTLSKESKKKISIKLSDTETTPTNSTLQSIVSTPIIQPETSTAKEHIRVPSACSAQIYLGSGNTTERAVKSVSSSNTKANRPKSPSPISYRGMNNQGDSTDRFKKLNPAIEILSAKPRNKSPSPISQRSAEKKYFLGRPKTPDLAPKRIEILGKSQDNARATPDLKLTLLSHDVKKESEPKASYKLVGNKNSQPLVLAKNATKTTSYSFGKKK